MFYSATTPAILAARPVKIAPGGTQPGEKVYVRMTADKSQDARRIPASLDDDASALSLLYEQFRRPIHSYIYRLLGNLEDADDVTQEVFVRACISWDGLYDRNNLSAWLYRIATNLCVDLLRRRKLISWWPLLRRNPAGEHLEGASEEEASYLPSDSGGIPEIAEREHIRLALANIPAEYAIVLVLSAAQGIPYQEIAVIVGISPNAAATRISRAKRMFAEQYQRLSVTNDTRGEPR